LVGAQNTALLRAIPGLGELGKFLLGPAAEQVMLLENIGTSVLVSDNQLADLHRLMEEAAGILDLEAPELYVRQNPVPNAYTLAIAGRKPFVVIHTSLVELLTPAELQVFLEHPTRHLLNIKKILSPNSAKLLAQELGASLCVQSQVFGLFCRTPKSI
jgi:Zn-dependent protease with chaperone function